MSDLPYWQRDEDITAWVSENRVRQVRPNLTRLLAVGVEDSEPKISSLAKDRLGWNSNRIGTIRGVTEIQLVQSTGPECAEGGK